MKDIGRFFKEVINEMAKVVWPSFNTLIGSTIIVLILIGIFALYLWGVDFVFSRLASWVFRSYGGSV